MDQSPTKPLFERKKNLQNKLELVTQEMYKRNLELAQTNKTLSILRKIDELALESQESLEIFCNMLASSIAATGEYPFVGILTRLHTHRNSLGMYGLSTNTIVNQEQKALLSKTLIDTSHEWFDINEKFKLLAVKDISKRDIKQFLGLSEHEIEQLEKAINAQSILLIKLNARQKLVGLMAIGFLQAPESIGPDELQLFARLSEAVGVAVDNRLLFEENKHIVNQLQKTNDKLKALDEAKDEFISMASHQLRTPLTSVKGYLSMVLEGDAGKVSKTQQKLLDQAFISSQRMVYLIADLLNVSRLRTGKFVIEALPTNLAEVVEGEINQLVETAAGRNLKLTYKKPAKFPTLMMDETKIRQVVMNFVDNAIYYTPSGGHIVVSVAETPKSIDFAVTDDGIGIPPTEQHHLFTKFFRAGNARKARPDGTGLGLFMAKKVVVAQGGSIIFNSKEGKGSTFGFSFAKSKLAVPKNAVTNSDEKRKT